MNGGRARDSGGVSDGKTLVGVSGNCTQLSLGQDVVSDSQARLTNRGEAGTLAYGRAPAVGVMVLLYA